MGFVGFLMLLGVQRGPGPDALPVHKKRQNDFSASTTAPGHLSIESLDGPNESILLILFGRPQFSADFLNAGKIYRADQLIDSPVKYEHDFANKGRVGLVSKIQFALHIESLNRAGDSTPS